MLHKPDVHTEELLKLADFIDGLPADSFSMHAFGQYQEPRCICGWLLHNRAHIDKSDAHLAAKILGLDENTAFKLFSYPEMTTHEAAKMLRHLAVTGELP